jgi:hypothetical protein
MKGKSKISWNQLAWIVAASALGFVAGQILWVLAREAAPRLTTVQLQPVPGGPPVEGGEGQETA